MLRQGAESFRVLRTETTVSLQTEGGNEPSSKKAGGLEDKILQKKKFSNEKIE